MATEKSWIVWYAEERHSERRLSTHGKEALATVRLMLRRETEGLAKIPAGQTLPLNQVASSPLSKHPHPAASQLEEKVLPLFSKPVGSVNQALSHY